MRAKLLLLVLATSLAASGAIRLTVDQLVKFISSSIELEHDDGKVAKYLKNVTLSEQLEERTIESLMGLGAGPKTVAALMDLRESTLKLPKAAPPEPEPEREVIPPPSPAEQKQIIEDVRNYATYYTKNLPDFICIQVTRRYGDPSGLEIWQKLDTVTARLSYFEQKEDYQVILLNNRPVDLTMDEVGGSTSSGEFGTMLKQLFDLETEARFEWMRWGKLRGKLAHVYGYQVRKEKSKWAITYEKSATIVPAYSGLVYVDKDTLQVLRITLEAQGIPPTFPVQEARTVLDYDYTDISGQEFLLPLKFDMRMRQGRLLVKNEVEFRKYRKFGAEAVITFDTPEPLPEEMTTEEAVEK